jgi:hypothetical protein
MLQDAKADEPGAAVISAKMAKALANPWRAQILAELTVRPMSPSQFVDQVGGELTNIARCFRQLARWNYIELVEEKRGGRRRGGVEHIYRRSNRAYFDLADWEAIPRYLKDDISANILASYFARVTEAVEAGTFDADAKRHLSWDAGVLDQQAWSEITERLDAILEWIPQLKTESAVRLAESDEEPILITVGLAAFRSPRPPDIPAGPRAKSR